MHTHCAVARGEAERLSLRAEGFLRREGTRPCEWPKWSFSPLSTSNGRALSLSNRICPAGMVRSPNSFTIAARRLPAESALRVPGADMCSGMLLWCGRRSRWKAWLPTHFADGDFEGSRPYSALSAARCVAAEQCRVYLCHRFVERPGRHKRVATAEPAHLGPRTRGVQSR